MGVVGFQIEIERIFSFARIFARRCCLQTENLEKLIFFNENWPNDLKIHCKSSYNLVEFFENDVDLEEKLKEFEGEFEKDEVVEL